MSPEDKREIARKRLAEDLKKANDQGVLVMGDIPCSDADEFIHAVETNDSRPEFQQQITNFQKALEDSGFFNGIN